MLVCKIAAFTMLVPGAVIGLIPWLMVRSRQQPLVDWSRVATWPGLLLLIGGALTYGWCAWEFGARGGGTPAPFDPPRRMVVTGLYRVVRNPMYIGVVVALLGEAILYGSAKVAVYAAGVAVVFHTWVVAYEEPKLRRMFGPSFTTYRRSVARWVPWSWLARKSADGACADDGQRPRVVDHD